MTTGVKSVNDKPGFVFTIFGSTGDLTYRKLLPALYHLQHRGLLSDDFQIRCIGRRDYDTETYLDLAKPWIEKQSRFKFDDATYASFRKKIRYIKLEFTQSDAYSELLNHPPGSDNLYYFAVAPEHFEVISQGLHGIGYLNEGLHRVILEKPFGDSLEHARAVNDSLSEIFGEGMLYHIDHYLGKEMIQNILAIRFSNRLFEGVWNKDAIEQIQITAAETVGVETRGSYYEQAGALKDMMQNHLLQILSYVVMEKPASLNNEDMLEERLLALNALQLDDVVIGQYHQNGELKAYRSEDKVKVDSKTETYAALKASLKRGPLAGVPLYLRTGKRLDHRATYIKVVFKKAVSGLYSDSSQEVLTIKVQPDEGVSLQFNAKKPGTLNTITSVKMDFCQSCILENRINTPEAYERLLDDALHHDRSLFTPWKMVELGWRYGQIIQNNRENGRYPLVFYPAGSNGPEESQRMLAQNGHGWLDEKEISY